MCGQASGATAWLSPSSATSLPKKSRLVCLPNLGSHYGRTGKLGTGPCSVCYHPTLVPIVAGRTLGKRGSASTPELPAQLGLLRRQGWPLGDVGTLRGTGLYCRAWHPRPRQSDVPRNRVWRRPGLERSQNWEGKGLRGTRARAGYQALGPPPGQGGRAERRRQLLSPPGPFPLLSGTGGRGQRRARASRAACPRAPASYPHPPLPSSAPLVPRLLAPHSRVQHSPAPRNSRAPAARSGRTTLAADGRLRGRTSPAGRGGASDRQSSEVPGVLRGTGPRPFAELGFPNLASAPALRRYRLGARAARAEPSGGKACSGRPRPGHAPGACRPRSAAHGAPCVHSRGSFPGSLQGHPLS